MKKNLNYLKSTLLLTGLLFLGCETGVDVNKGSTKDSGMGHDGAILSGIVDKPTNQVVTTKYGKKLSVHEIYSNSAQPGYYLQVAFFEVYKPNSRFEQQLKHSGLKYTILNKYNRYYALVGAYKSYNEAHSHIHSVNAKLHKKSFVVHVLRP